MEGANDDTAVILALSALGVVTGASAVATNAPETMTLDPIRRPRSEARKGARATAVTNGVARNGSGGALSVQLLFDVALVDGEPLAVAGRFRVECVGETASSGD